jgi:hypothetical protein
MSRYEDFLNFSQLQVILKSLNNLINRRLKAHIKRPIGLFKNKSLNIIKFEALGILQMINQPAGGGKQNGQALSNPTLLMISLFPPNQAPRNIKRQPLQASHRFFLRLHAQLSSGTYHQHSCAVFSSSDGFVLEELVD